MQITKQIAIFLENRPGTLARVCDTFAREKINIYAFSTSDTIDHTVMRLVVSDYRKALQLCEERGALSKMMYCSLRGTTSPGHSRRLRASFPPPK